MPQTAQQKLDDIVATIKAEIEAIEIDLGQPSGITPQVRQKHFDKLRMLHWFLQLLTEKEQIVVPKKEEEKK